MKVQTEVFRDMLPGDYADVDGLIVTCSRCGHEVEVFGIDEPSKKLAGFKLSQECPRFENNFYEVE